MALRVKEKRTHQSSQDINSPTSPIFRRRKSLPKNSPTNHLPPVAGYTSSGQLKPYKGFEATSPHKTQVIVVGCSQHQSELLKFIDVSTNIFGAHCEVCIVSSGTDLKQMKLERIPDIHARLNKMLKSQIEQFKALEHKVEVMSKEIKITNAMLQPIMTKIDWMEKQSISQVEGLFRRLRMKFTRFNPFKATKDEINKRVDDINDKIDELSYNDVGGLESMKNLLRNEARMKEESKNFILQMKSQMENNKAIDMPSEKDIGQLENVFEDFIDTLTASCNKFAHNVTR